MEWLNVFKECLIYVVTLLKAQCWPQEHKSTPLIFRTASLGYLCEQLIFQALEGYLTSWGQEPVNGPEDSDPSRFSFSGHKTVFSVEHIRKPLLNSFYSFSISLDTQLLFWEFSQVTACY